MNPNGNHINQGINVQKRKPVQLRYAVYISSALVFHRSSISKPGGELRRSCRTSNRNPSFQPCRTPGYEFPSRLPNRLRFRAGLAQLDCRTADRSAGGKGCPSAACSGWLSIKLARNRASVHESVFQRRTAHAFIK